MKKGWEIKSLKDIGEIFSGNSINSEVKKDKYLNLTEGLPYIATKDVGYDSFIDYDNGVRIPFTEKDSFRIAPKNSVLICAEGGSAGRKYGRTNQDICFVNKLFAITPESETTSKYVFYWYQSDAFQVEFRSRLTGLIGGVSKRKFETIPIPIPPLPEQKRIVVILDKCFEAIDKAKANVERNLQNAKELFQSKLKQIFTQKGKGWEEKILGDACTLQRGFDLPKRLRIQGSFPLVSSSGVSDFHNEFKVKAPGVATGRSGSIGSVFYIEDDFWPLNTVLYVKDFHGNCEKFVYYLLHHFDLAKYASGTGVPTLNRNFVHCEKVHIPESISEQNKIVRQLDGLKAQMQTLESKYQKELDYFDELKKSILKKAFDGELTA